MGRHSPVGGWELPPASGSSEGVLQLLSDTVAGGQQHKAGAFSIGHGINEHPGTSPFQSPDPSQYLAGAFTTCSSAGSPRRRRSAGSSAVRLSSPRCPGGMGVSTRCASSWRNQPPQHSPSTGRSVGLLRASRAPVGWQKGQTPLLITRHPLVSSLPLLPYLPDIQLRPPVAPARPQGPVVAPSCGENEMGHT